MLGAKRRCMVKRHDSILGRKNGIDYSLVSGDYLRWQPVKVLD